MEDLLTAPLTPDHTKPLVVVVDDAIPIARGLARVLESKGYRTLVFSTAAETRAWLENAPEAPAALLVDVHLPDGSGIALAKDARALFADATSVIILSGDTSIENLRALPEAGAHLFIAKPVHVPTLLTQLQPGTFAQ